MPWLRVACLVVAIGIGVVASVRHQRAIHEKLPTIADAPKATTAYGCIEAEPFAAATSETLTDATDELGLDFVHVVGPLGSYYVPESVGSGSGGDGGGGETVGGGGTIELDPWEVSVGLSDFAPPDMVSPGLKGDAVLSALDPTVLDYIVSGVQFVGDAIEWRVQVELSAYSLRGDLFRGLGDSIGDGFEWVGDGVADWVENDTASVAAAGIFGFVGGFFRGAGGMVGAVADLPGTVKAQVETGMAYYNATGSVLNGITGSLGMNDLAEAIVGTDIITGEQISGDERFDRAASEDAEVQELFSRRNSGRDSGRSASH